MPAATVDDYLAALPADRRAALTAVRKEIDRCIPAGYQSGIQFGMISWYVPLSTYPVGYGGNAKVALPYIGLVSQKSHMALHMMCFYGHATLKPWFDAEYKKSGKKLDMGMGCLRFKTLDELALDRRHRSGFSFGSRTTMPFASRREGAVSRHRTSLVVRALAPCVAAP